MLFGSFLSGRRVVGLAHLPTLAVEIPYSTAQNDKIGGKWYHKWRVTVRYPRTQMGSNAIKVMRYGDDFWRECVRVRAQNYASTHDWQKIADAYGDSPYAYGRAGNFTYGAGVRVCITKLCTHGYGEQHIRHVVWGIPTRNIHHLTDWSIVDTM